MSENDTPRDGDADRLAREIAPPSHCGSDIWRRIAEEIRTRDAALREARAEIERRDQWSEEIRVGIEWMRSEIERLTAALADKEQEMKERCVGLVENACLGTNDERIGLRIAKAIRTLAARAALDAAGPDGWRNIDSAPKDGTPVDLWCEFRDRGQRQTNCRWHMGDARWIDDRGMPFLVPITHWRPLPPPPRAPESKP